MSIELSGLNDAQRKAVLHTEGPLLVLAGAGSGKTRVLTYRIANLLENHDCNPWEILAITFTNKAAAEMRERVGQLVGPRSRGMWISTFHSMCVRLLRANAERLGFTRNFTIYDDVTSKRLVKSVMEDLDIDPRRFSLNNVRSRISHAKNELIVPEDFSDQAHDPQSRVAARVYTRLQKRLKAANAFDFDDLLLYAYLLLKHYDDVLAAYQDRFQHIMVDEYQDTNHAQYAITHLLAARHHNIMVVGDDDQSIYSWRGADITNILDFEKDYPTCTTIKLEQNYRSKGNILDAANAIIAHNSERKQKHLFTNAGAGERIQVYAATDERDEGRWIASRIEQRHKAGLSYNQMAVFYRTNAQSRMLEDMLLRTGVPYRIVGGTRFFERAEISDVMAYLTLVVNPADDMAAHRVINTPRRGIGKSTINHIEEVAREHQTTFMNAVEECIADASLRASTRESMAAFVSLLGEARTYEGNLRNVVEMIIDKTGLLDALRVEGTDEALSRIENIQELLSVVDEYADTHDTSEALFEAPLPQTSSSQAFSSHIPSPQSPLPEAPLPQVFPSNAPLQNTAQQNSTSNSQNKSPDSPPMRVLRGDSLADFIEWVRLRTDLDTLSEDGRAVTLMTIHAAKGLEFDCVFVAGLEESLFPHSRIAADPQNIEEERRLAYVAITRARSYLHLSYASHRQLFGRTQTNPVSRFIQEIPSELRTVSGVGSAGFTGSGWEKRGSRRGIAGAGAEAGGGRVFDRSSASHPKKRETQQHTSTGIDFTSLAADKANTTYSEGDAVYHKAFGHGTVKDVQGDSILVRFDELGETKKLLKEFAPLVKIAQP